MSGVLTVFERGLRSLGLAGMAFVAAWPGAARAQGPASAEAGAVWQFSLSDDRHSDALSLRQMDDDRWAAALQPRAGRNLAYVEQSLRLERRPQTSADNPAPGWTLALLARQSASLVASHDALALAAQVARGQRPATDASWQADLRLRGFAGFGVELGRLHQPAPGWTWRWSAQALALTRWRERQLQGPVGFDAASVSYHFALQSDELNDRLQAPFLASPAPRGAGLLLATELGWQGERGGVSLTLFDGGWLHWSALPRQRMALDTRTQTVDADGYLVYAPLIQGQNSQGATTRSQPWRGRLRGDWRLTERDSLQASVEHRPDFGALPALYWQRQSGELRWRLGWQLHQRRATLDAGWRGWQIQAGADRLGQDARSRTLGLAYAWPMAF